MQNQRKFLAFAALILTGTALHAQHGCFHSPEAPTGALLLVGGIGMSLGSSLLSRLVRNRAARPRR